MSDYNRQSLDSVVSDRLFTRLDDVCRTTGFDVSRTSMCPREDLALSRSTPLCWPFTSLSIATPQSRYSHGVVHSLSGQRLVIAGQVGVKPDGSLSGGKFVVTGTPEQVARCKASHTGRFLKPHLSRAN